MPRTFPPALAVLLVTAPLHPSPVSAQQAASTGSGALQLSERDSARVVREARSEQARFERVRRDHLPWAWGGGGGECDERIGRFCLTHTDSESDWEPEPEPEKTRTARERLIDHLGRATRRVPGDPWMAGQRVRYLVEAGRYAEAGAAARECRAAAWWCAALVGFAHHQAGQAQPADSAFAAMLDGMPPEERERWTELEVLLDGCTHRAYRHARGPERERFEERFWRLADPFHTLPGNELRSEHFARHVWDRLQDRAKSAEGISWGSDLREILLRYGWPQGWERVRPRPGQTGPPALVSHYANSDRRLLPPCEVFAEDGGLHRGQWDTEPRAPKTGYSIPMPDSALKWVVPVEHQVAVFRRGDSALVVAAYALPRDSVPEGATFRAALALVPATTETPRVAPFPLGGASDVVVAAAAPGQLLLSLEVLDLEARRAARARHGLEIRRIPRGLPYVSDLLLLRSPDELPDSLDPAVGQARASTRVRPGERLGVYWEVYGLSPERPEALTMSLRLAEEGTGWLKRLARRIGLVDRVPPVRVRWQERPSGGVLLPRSLAVQIPEDLDPGRYAIELAISLPGREALVVRRAVEVLPP